MFAKRAFGAVGAAVAGGAALYLTQKGGSTAAPPSGRNTAVCILAPLPGGADSGVRGTVTFSQPKGHDYIQTTVHVDISGLKPGKHGFHIHQLGDLRQGCTSAGGHFNPGGSPHGGPQDTPEARHVGDLGNIEAGADGKVNAEFTDYLISLRGVNSIVGRSVIVHADEDDLGRGGHADSKTTGHAGARVACGVIGVGPDVQ